MINKKVWLGVAFALVFSLANAEQASFKQKFSGKKLTMEGAFCAGISFSKNGNEALMFGEAGALNCSPVGTLPLRVRWIDSRTFILIEKNQPNEISPPRTFLYKVKVFNGSKVTLTEIWTGWNQYNDDDENYTLN